MATIRIYLPGPYQVGETLTLPSEAQRHLVSVLRLREGDTFRLFDGERAEDFIASLTGNGKRTQAHITEALPNDRESPMRTVLVVSVSRGERMDYSIQKATELGVTEIQPILSERTVVKLTPEKAEKRQIHWQRVAISAAEQSGRSKLPHIRPVKPFAEYLSSREAIRGFLLAPEATERCVDALSTPCEAAEVWIGPEGGFSPSEIERCQTAGLISVRLGPRILRTETAPMVVLTLIQSAMGDL